MKTCVKCNIEGNKNTRGYKVGLFERFDKEEAEAIIDYCETSTKVKKIGADKVDWLECQNEPMKYSCEEFKLIELEYKSKLKLK